MEKAYTKDSTQEEILELVKTVMMGLGMTTAGVDLDMSHDLMSRYELDSLDTLEIAIGLEDELGDAIGDTELSYSAWETIGDVVGEVRRAMGYENPTN